MDGEENNKWPVGVSYDGGHTWNAGIPSPNITLTNYIRKEAWVMASSHRFWAMESECCNALTSTTDGTNYVFEDDIVTREIKHFALNAMFAPGSHKFLINRASTYTFIESAEDGHTFDTITSSSIYPYGYIYKIAFADPMHGMAVSSTINLITSDGWAQWQRIDNDCNYCTLIDFSYPAVEAAYKLIKYINVNNPGQYLWKIAKSTNQGQSWINIALPDVNLYRMIFVNSPTGYLFGENVTTGE